jgi:hypothetical protein
MEKKTHKLQEIHIDYLLTRLAESFFDRATIGQILKDFTEKFGFKISQANVTYFKTTRKEQISKRMREVAEKIIQDIPIAQRGFRLKAIWDIYFRAKDPRLMLQALRDAHSETNDVGDKIADAIKTSGQQTHYHFNFGAMSDEDIRSKAGQYSRMLFEINRNN